jgi:hypothetical protein
LAGRRGHPLYSFGVCAVLCERDGDAGALGGEHVFEALAKRDGRVGVSGFELEREARRGF